MQLVDRFVLKIPSIAMRALASNAVALISGKGVAAAGDVVNRSAVAPACFCLQDFRPTCRSVKPVTKVLDRVEPGVARYAEPLQNRRKFPGNRAVLVFPRLPGRPIEPLWLFLSQFGSRSGVPAQATEWDRGGDRGISALKLILPEFRQTASMVRVICTSRSSDARIGYSDSTYQVNVT